MILQELFEASTFRKRSTSQMTYGFEFEIMVGDKNFDDIFERLVNTYPFDDYVNKNIKNFYFGNYKTKYGFASKDDIAEYNSEKNPQEAKLVKEILDLSDKSYKLFLLEALLKVKNKINMDNVSDFDDYLKKNYSEKVLNSLSTKKYKYFDENIKSIIDLYLPYVSYYISNNEIQNYIYDKNKDVLYLKTDIKIENLEELFEDSEDIIDELEENYNNRISEMVYDELNNRDSLEYVEEILEKNNISNVNVVSDQSLGDDGVEIVTEKIYGINEAISQFNKITSLIQNDESLYTDERTGLHINIGTWDDISQLDLTKLLVFSNETQILKKMDRQSNRYTKSLVKRLVSYLKTETNLKYYNDIIKDMNEELLISAIHTSFMDFNKLKNSGYIEIRGFGNENYENKKNYIIKMIRYLSRIMEIASDPEEAKQQYIKKLYKIFDFDSELSGEQKEEEIISNNSLLTQNEISTILRFLPNYVKDSFKKPLQSPKENSSFILNNFILNIIGYEKRITNADLRILYKLLKNMDIPKDFYEIKIKGKSDKIDNLFQNYVLKGKV